MKTKLKKSDKDAAIVSIFATEIAIYILQNFFNSLAIAILLLIYNRFDVEFKTKVSLTGIVFRMINGQSTCST